MADIPSTHKPDGFDEAFAEWRKALRLADDFAEGHIYTKFFGALALLQMHTEEMLRNWRPDVEVGKAYRLPLSPERQEQIAQDFTVPDHPPEQEDP